MVHDVMQNSNQLDLKEARKVDDILDSHNMEIDEMTETEHEQREDENENELMDDLSEEEKSNSYE